MVTKGVEDAPSGAPCLLGISDWQDHGELITAQAAELHRVAKDDAEEVRGLGEYLITGWMAKRVVDVLELVEVEKEESAAAFSGQGIAEMLVEGLSKAAPVQEIGERVVVRLMMELLLE